jgi:hypothetical protein
LTYYGVLPAQVDDVISVVLGIPMFALSMIILVWGAVLLVRFLNGGRTPDSAT